MKDLALQVTQLRIQFGGEAPLFHDLSLEVAKGEFVMLIGPNGSGKTSLIKTLLGIYQPVSGQVQIYENKVGYVPQYLQKDEFSPMTVRELFALKLPHASIWSSLKNLDDEIKQYLAKTKVEHVVNRQLKHLSGGEYQRVMIAYALVGRPGLLILDEPISGIDIHGEQEFYELIEQIHEQEEITIIMISHDIDVVYRYATQVICLNRKLICQGIPKNVLTPETIKKTFSDRHGIYHHQHQGKKKKHQH